MKPYTKTPGKPSRNRNKKNKKRTMKRKSMPYTIVFGHIYSDGCIHCQNMQNDWNIVCSKTKIPLYDIGDDYENRIHQFNTQYNTDLKYTGFPTIFRVKNKSAVIDYYNGDRTSQSILKWLQTK
jgi:hypothetical protein